MDNVIEISGLMKTFPGFSLGPLDLTVPRGSIYGFIGANGAGKTTTIDLMLGMGAPDGGSIRIFGLHHEKDEVEIKRRTGYFGVDTRYDQWGKVHHLLKFWKRWYPTWDERYCADLMQRFGLKDHDPIATLSTGSRTKLGLLLALSHRPELLLLDEPFSGLDAPSKRELQHELLEAMQDERRTVFISSHNLDELERFADNLAILKEGKLLFQGITDELLEAFCAVTVETPPQSRLRKVEGALLDRHKGNQYQLIVDRRSDALAELNAQSVVPLQPVPVKLEELCAALLSAQEAKR